MTYLSAEQVEQLLKAINPARVGTDGKGFSHVEAYEIKAHLTRIFGFARWSWTVTDIALIFESGDQRTNRKNEPYTAWTIAYRVLGTLTVNAPDGTVLASYAEAATGSASNQPSRADAHDLAVKTGESQALKRCAVNLGDQFGLSLYNAGSKASLVKRSFVTPGAPATKGGSPVDQHITEHLAPENPEPAPETPSPLMVAPDSGEVKTPPAPNPPGGREGSPTREQVAEEIRDLVIAAAARPAETAKRDLRTLMIRVAREKVANVLVADRDGVAVTLMALAENEMKTATRVAQAS